MSLEQAQINRYARHVLLPEVGVAGQEKLLAAAVSICGKDVQSVAAAIYYLAAAGIGQIDCQVDDAGGFGALAAEIQDLNRDVCLTLADGRHCAFRVIMGPPDYVAQKQALLLTAFVPTVLSLYHCWQGVQLVASERGSLLGFLAKLQAAQGDERAPYGKDEGGAVFSRCFLNALSAVEVIKLVLGIGGPTTEFLHADLLSMEFAKVKTEGGAAALQAFCALVPTDCQAGKSSGGKVLIVGAGGLGSPAAYALALSGGGTVGLADYDTVELSNLNRQILHSESRIGMAKVASAACFLKRLNPRMDVKQYAVRLDAKNAAEIIAGYDVVIAAVDNYPGRLLLNDACFFAGKPLVEAGATGFDGTIRTILPRQGPCYRCSNAALSDDTPLFRTAPGVFGPVPGVMGFLQAAEAMKLLTGVGDVASERMIFFDGLFSEFCTIKLARNAACPLCGAHPHLADFQESGFAHPGGAEEKE